LIESNHNPEAIGDQGRALGHLQIHAECVEDVNNWYGTDYCHQDMHIPELAVEVFFKYMAMGETLFIKKYTRFPEEQDLVKFWNHGIYYQPKDSKYYEKYRKAKQEKEKKTTKGFEVPQFRNIGYTP